MADSDDKTRHNSHMRRHEPRHAHKAPFPPAIEKWEEAEPNGVPLPSFPGVTKEASAVGHMLQRISRQHERLMHMMFSTSDMPHGQGWIIKILTVHPSLSQTELADMILVERAAMSGMLRRMEKSGLVERKRDENDQRVVRVNVTPTGRQYADNIDARIAELMQRTYGQLDTHNCEQVLAILQQVYNSQKTLSEEWDHKE